MPIPVIAISWFWVVVNREPRILLLHHSFCLMSPLLDCIFLKPFDMMCRGHHRHFDFSQVLLGCIGEIPSLPLDDLSYHQQPPLTPCQYKLGHVYLALLPLGKDIQLILVYHHIFLYIGLFNLSCDIVTDLSSNNSLLM